MIELYTYKLLQNYLNDFLTEIKWIEIYNDQFNKDERPYNDISCFIEFERTDVTTSRFYRSDGKLIINFYLSYPITDNYNSKKKNINDNFKLLEFSKKFNQYLNVLDSSSYPQEQIKINNMTIDISDIYVLGNSNFIGNQIYYNNNYQINKLTYIFEYGDNSTAFDPIFLTGWTYNSTILTLDSLGSYNNDYNDDDYQVRDIDNQIFIRSVELSGTTLTINGYSYKDGVPIELEYGVSNVEDELPIYQSSNSFEVSSGSYWVYMRNVLGDGVYYENNPVIV